MMIDGRLVDADTANMIAAVEDVIDAGGMVSQADWDAVDDRMYAAYCAGDTGLADYLDALSGRIYDAQARGR